MVNGLLPRRSRPESAKNPRRRQICPILRKSGAYSLRIWTKTKAGAEPAFQAVRLGSIQIRWKRAAGSRREGHVFSDSCGVLAEHRHSSAADGVAAAEIGADVRN